MDLQRRQRYLARYEELKHQGESFFPHTIFNDTMATLMLFLVLVALAVFVGAPLEERADPTNATYVPRPEWYFMFLFELLKYFPGDLEWVGVAVVPGVAILFLLLLPFLDRSPTRHPRQRHLAMNMAAVTVLAIAFLTLKAFDFTPTTAMSMIATGPSLGSSAPVVTKPKLTAAQDEGKRLVSQNCASCHRIGDTGGSLAPDLTHVGSRHDASWLHSFIENPKAVNQQSPMPAFLPSLSHEQIEYVAQYLSMLR